MIELSIAARYPLGARTERKRQESHPPMAVCKTVAETLGNTTSGPIAVPAGPTRCSGKLPIPSAQFAQRIWADCPTGRPSCALGSGTHVADGPPTLSPEETTMLRPPVHSDTSAH